MKEREFNFLAASIAFGIAYILASVYNSIFTEISATNPRPSAWFIAINLTISIIAGFLIKPKEVGGLNEKA